MGLLDLIFPTPPRITTSTKRKRKHSRAKSPHPAKGTKVYYLEIVTEGRRGLTLRRVKILVPKSASSFGLYKVGDDYVTVSGYSIPFNKIPDQEYGKYYIKAEIHTKEDMVSARLLTSGGRVKETSRWLGPYAPSAFRKARQVKRVRVVNLNAKHKFVRVTI